MADLAIPNKMLTEIERASVVQSAKENLLSTYSGVEAYVIVAQMQKMVDELKEELKDKALATVQGKEMQVFGAKVATRSKREYEYNAPTLSALDEKKKAIDADMKAIKKVLEVKGEYVDPSTGDVNTASLVSDGITIAVTFPKQ